MCGGVFQVLLCSPTGNRNIIDVAKSTEAFKKTTVKKFKELAVNRMQEPTLRLRGCVDFRFVFESKQLEEKKTFAYYRIEPMSTIVTVVKQSGG